MKPGFFELLSFAWVNAPIRKARKNEEIVEEDLYFDEASGAADVFVAFDREWAETLKQGSNEKQVSRPLLRTLSRLFGKTFFLGGVFKLLWSALVICGAFYFVRSLLLYVDVEDDDEEQKDHPYMDVWTGWMLASGFFCAALLWGASYPMNSVWLLKPF
jgi:hypothetical protein